MEKFKLHLPVYQTLLIVFTSCVLYFSMSFYGNKFRNFDKEPILYKLEEKLVQNSSQIETGFSIKNFREFDTIKNEFLIDGYIWFIFDTDKFSEEVIGKFSFLNTKKIKVESIDKIKDQEIEIEKNKKFLRYHVKVKFFSALNYSDFPLDSHRIYIELENRFIPIEKGHFVINPKNFRILEKDLYSPGWKNINMGLENGYNFIELNDQKKSLNLKFPGLLFYIDFINDDFKNALLIFLPILITFFLSTFLFSIEHAVDRGMIAEVTGFSIATLLGFLFVIETISPRVSYFMLSDKFFLLCLLLTFCVFLTNFYLKKLKQFEGLILLLFHITLIISWLLILFL